jgi:dTDP-4-dehydrorhamnose reductase
MRILVTGAQGQLGQALRAVLAEHTLRLTDLNTADITDRSAIRRVILDFQPHTVIHTAAMTNVDGCALNPDAAYRVNGLGTRNIALACAEVAAELLYVSTNEVFDGQKGQPYLELDPPNPINAYGRSKLAGEQFAQWLCRRFYIVRTAWLFAPGGQNFIHKILQIADATGQVRVVTDEVSSPTYVLDLAQALARLVGSGAYGWYHFVNDGWCSRYAFAQAILDCTGRRDVKVLPISHMEFHRPSQPPVYSALRNFVGAELGIGLRPWREALAAYCQAYCT